MPTRTSPNGSELFIVDNIHDDWEALGYLLDLCQIAKSIGIATGYSQ